MNIEYINACIPLRAILGKLNLIALQETETRAVYPSPFSSDHEAILTVDVEQNLWADLFTQSEGGPFDLIAALLRYQKQNCAVPDVLDWFKQHIGYPSLLDGIALPKAKAPELKYVYKSPILNPMLISFVAQKGIELNFARKYLFQIGITNVDNGREFSALGLKTEDGGWCVLSPHLNTFVGSPSVTYIPGQKYQFRRLHIFKNIFMYLKAVKDFNKGNLFADECLILNSFECLDQAAAYIRGHGYRQLYTWLGADPNGQQARKNFALLCRAENDLQHRAVI